jgi:hypothetical protein
VDGLAGVDGELALARENVLQVLLNLKLVVIVGIKLELVLEVVDGDLGESVIKEFVRQEPHKLKSAVIVGIKLGHVQEVADGEAGEPVLNPQAPAHPELEILDINLVVIAEFNQV